MTSLSHYYETKLYPLQDGVLNTIAQKETDFFLTGGTALSRAYFNHRYSDDLDFFINNSETFNEQLDLILQHLSDKGYKWTTENLIRSENYCRVFMYKEAEIKLKIDFVNDTVPHYGNIQNTNLYYRTDSIRNILSNKLSAIYRYEAKDIIDIREISLKTDVDWHQALQEARQKEASIDIPIISEIMIGIPKEEFDKVTWINKPVWENFTNDIRQITKAMLTGEKNKTSK